MKPRLVEFAILVSLSTAPTLAAQEVRSGQDPLARMFFTPEHVLQYGKLIGLRPDQRTWILEQIKQTEIDILDFQVAMTESTVKLMKELRSGPTVNEHAVLGLVDGVLAVERNIKRRQMQLLIRVKNGLDEQQQNRLEELRKLEGGPGQLLELEHNAVPK